MSVVLLGSVELVVPVGENVTMKFRSIANGMTTGTIGTAAVKRMEVHHTLLVVTCRSAFELTPTDKRYTNVSSGDLDKHKKPASGT